MIIVHLCYTYWDFLEKKLYPPPTVEDIEFFEVDPSNLLCPLELSIFLLYPPGIPTNFTLPPGNFD